MASLGGMPTAPPPSQPDRTAARPTRIPDLQPGRSRTTERLVLRPWRDEDAEAFGSLNADPEVMSYFPAPLDRAASDELLGRARAHVDDHGWGFWALEERSTGAFIGLTGLSQPSFEAAFTPCVEIGWRLVRSAWGQGYATEAAIAALDVGFHELGLDEIVSFTPSVNLRSRAVMQRIGMRHALADDFDHPLIDPANELCHHVLYRISRDDDHSGGPDDQVVPVGPGPVGD